MGMTLKDNAARLGKKAVTDYRIPLLTILLFVVMSFTKERFASAYNIYSIADSVAGYGIAAIGFTFILFHSFPHSKSDIFIFSESTFFIRKKG